MRFRRVQLLLNGFCIGTVRIDWHSVCIPILQQHRDRRGTTTVFRLFYKGYVQPHASVLLGRWLDGSSQERKEQ